MTRRGTADVVRKVLLLPVALLLSSGPASARTALTQPLPDTTGTTAGLAVTAGPLAARADTTDLDRLLWSASTLQRVLGERDYATALLLGLAARQWPAGADAAGDLTTLVERVGAHSAELNACRHADPVEGTLCTLERLHALAPPGIAPALADEATRLVGRSLRAPAPAQAIASGLVLHRQAALQGYLEQRLAEVWPAVPRAAAAIEEGAGALPAVALALEPWLRASMGHAIGDGAAAVLAANPTLHALLEAYPVLGDLRAGRLDGAQLQTVVGRYSTFFGALVDSAHVAVRLIGAATDPGAGGRAGAPAPADLASWAARRSLVYLASRSAAHAGGGGEGMAASVAALGNAAVDLHRGLADLPAGLLAAGRGAAAFALTGNVLGLASGMTALLNVAGGGHNTAATEVRALRGVVDSLRIEVDGRFAHLDAAVDSVLTSLSGGFERLERAVAASGEASRREIAAVHAEVAALGQRFDRLEQNFQLYLEAGFDRDYARTRSRCLEHRQRFAPPHDQMDFATFSACLVDFRTRAVGDARDALLADRTTVATDDAAVIAALADTTLHNLARRVPLLARAAAQRYGQPGGAAATLANPLEWSIAADAYLRMLEEWPEHAMAVTTADLDALLAAGLELDAWSRGLTSDAGGRATPALLTAVLADHTRAVTELRAVVEAFAQGQQQRRLQRIPRDSLVRQVAPQDGAGPSMAVPTGLIDRLPADALAAAMLGLNPIEMRYRVELTDSTVRDNFSRGFLRGTRHDRRHYARPDVIIEAVIGDELIAAFGASGEPILYRTDQMDGGADSERVRSSTVHVEDPAARFLAEQWPRLSRGDDWTAIPVRGADAGVLRAAVETELERYAAQSLDNLFRSVCTQPAPAGAAEAERISAALQGMTATRALFGAWLRTGLSRTGAIDPGHAELLHGPGALHDQATLCDRVRRGDGMLRLLWLEDEPGRAAARAAAFLAARFDDAATLPEPLDIVAVTLERLRAAQRIQRTRLTAAR